MALAETARLIASLELKDNLSKGVNSATAGLGRMESKVSGLQGRLGKLSSNLRGGMSSALSTFSGRLKSFATAGLGLLGVGGLFSLAAAFKSSLEKAREFGDASIQLSRVTGLNIDTTSRLVDALDFYGVSAEQATKIAGMQSKNVGNLTKNLKTANKFEAEYGLKIRDAKGRTLDFNKQLLVSADYFNNKSIPASKKAAALAKLYGRSWQDLIPVLALGRKGIEKAQKDAISLSQADLDAITKNKQATREWDDAIGDLQIKIGIGLLPTITELVTTLTSWVDTHDAQIQQFFRDGVQTVKSVAGAVVGIVSGIKSAWDAIPAPVRDLLIKGIVADRTVKFLFGFSAADLAKGAIGGVASGLGNALVKAGIGKLFVQPVFVTNPGFTGGGGVPGAAAAGGSILGTAATIAAAVIPPVLLAIHTKNQLDLANTGSSSDVVNSGFSPFGPVMGPTNDKPSNGAKRMEVVLRPDEALREKLEGVRIATQSGTAAITRAFDTESRQVAAAIRAQETAVTVNVTATITAGSIARAVVTKGTYSTGHLSALNKGSRIGG